MVKKLTVMALAALAFTGAQAQEVKQGDRLVDLGIGVGDASGAMFTQRLGMEWIVKDNVINDKFSLGVGFQISNAVGAKYDFYNVGSYDYSYTLYIDKKPQRGPSRTETQKVNRSGYGTAKCDITRDDVSIMPTVSLHGKFVEKLDLYATFGLGLGLMNGIAGEYKEAALPGMGSASGGFSKADYRKESKVGSETWTTHYSYNDFDHAEWQVKEPGTKAVFSTAFFVGARYFFNDNWAVNAQLGLISANVNKNLGNSYNVFSVGATYKF